MSTKLTPFNPFYPAAGFARGQLVILTARWVLVLSGIVLTLLNPDFFDPASFGALRFQLAGLLALAAANFFLCVQVLLKRQTLEVVTYAASLFDLLLISGLVILRGGFDSNIYVFYFPALLALSVAFPLVITLALAGGVAALYGFIGLLSLNDLATDLPLLFIRVLLLAGVAFIGAQFSRIEAQRTTPAPTAPDAGVSVAASSASA
jgi:hypothetical protein